MKLLADASGSFDYDELYGDHADSDFGG